MHGSSGAQVVLPPQHLYSLICIAASDLKWKAEDLGLRQIGQSERHYYDQPNEWFDLVAEEGIDANEVIAALSRCFERDNDFALYIQNLSALHRRRFKYRRILSAQPMPTMDQIGPRALLEYGHCDLDLLANWLTWRKWLYDIDNRSAQETGYFFEPLLATCLGGAPADSRTSPIKRIDISTGEPTAKSRQVDCLVPDKKLAYEMKLRVTIAASGQGRFSEELSFPSECAAAGYQPILLVLDPTFSTKLKDLAARFEKHGGAVFIGEAAWNHMEEAAGSVVSVFIERYIKPVISQIESVELPSLQSLSFEWADDAVTISSSSGKSYRIPRIPSSSKVDLDALL